MECFFKVVFIYPLWRHNGQTTVSCCTSNLKTATSLGASVKFESFESLLNFSRLKYGIFSADLCTLQVSAVCWVWRERQIQILNKKLSTHSCRSPLNYRRSSRCCAGFGHPLFSRTTTWQERSGISGVSICAQQCYESSHRHAMFYDDLLHNARRETRLVWTVTNQPSNLTLKVQTFHPRHAYTLISTSHFPPSASPLLSFILLKTLFRSPCVCSRHHRQHHIRSTNKQCSIARYFLSCDVTSTIYF